MLRLNVALVAPLELLTQRLEAGELGRLAFESYGVAVGGQTWDGKPIPGWDAVTDAVRAGWSAGAAAVLAEVITTLEPRVLEEPKGFKLELESRATGDPEALADLKRKIADELPAAVEASDDDTETPHRIETER
jgi:hypothetical protein